MVLSEITEVEPDPQEDRAFVVRLSGARLPWTLRAKSKVRRECVEVTLVVLSTVDWQLLLALL